MIAENYSGFSGYGIRSIYPNWGVDSQTDETIPDPEEQTRLANIDTPAQPSIDRKAKKNMMWVGLIILIVVLLMAK